MLTALASGTLVRDPVERTSAAGKAYCTALVRVAVEGADPVLVSVIAFKADAVRALLALTQGDGVSVAARARAEEELRAMALDEALEIAGQA